MVRAVRPSLLAVSLVAAVLVGLVGAAALASPQPTPACRFCGDAFATAADQGVEVEVVESTAVVRVHEDGTATWTVRNRLSAGAEQFRESPGLLDRVAGDLQDGGWGLPRGVASVDASLDGDVVVLTARGHDAASRHAGVLVVDFLHDHGGQPWYVVNADRFVVRGPEGTVVTNDPASGRVDGREVTWRGSIGDVWSDNEIGGSPYVAFGPDRTTGTELRTTVALVLATLPIVVDSVRQFALVQSALFAVLLGAVAGVFRREDADPDEAVGEARLAALVAALGGVGAVLLVAGGHLGFAGPAVFVLGLGLLAAHPATRRPLRTPRRQAVAAAGLLAGTAAVLFVARSLLEPSLDPGEFAFRAAALAAPLAAMVPFGGALGDGRRPLAWLVVAVATFVATIASVADFANPPAGLGAGLLVVLAFGLAAVFPLVGGPVVALGHALARGESTS